MNYAIIDVETTGGKKGEEGITEIAIFKFDGHEIVDQFSSLVNPERDIMPFVVNLTGISNKMLTNAPKFYEIAKRVIEITEDCIFVAHNAAFDFRMVQLEFERLGFNFKRDTLCTVQLSRLLIPDLDSYSLGLLCKSLGIPLTDRHRAAGDALATTKLLQFLLEKDQNKNILSSKVKTDGVSPVKPKVKKNKILLSILNKLPNKTGIFYFHNTEGDIIYINKSKNIKAKVGQYFSSTDPKIKKIVRQTVEVSYEETGNDIIALLKLTYETQSIKPKFNKSPNKNLFTCGLYKKRSPKGYYQLYIDTLSRRTSAVCSYANTQEAANHVYKLEQELQICSCINQDKTDKDTCIAYQSNICKGAAIGEESVHGYNQRVNTILSKIQMPTDSLLLIGSGRTVSEKSVIVLEHGILLGYGFFDLNYQISNADILKNLITRLEPNKEANKIIHYFIRNKKIEKIIKF